MARNWADLPSELLRQCAQDLCPKDLSAFLAVCRSWRSAMIEDSNDGPWLMLAHKRGRKQWRDFFCLRSERVLRKALPEAKAKTCFSSHGWLLTIGKDWEIHMLQNPMSFHYQVIKLPNVTKFPNVDVEDLRWWYPSVYTDIIEKFVLSDSPITSSNYMVMVIYERKGWLALWKPGYEEWTMVTTPPSHVDDVIFYKGCFLILNNDRIILRCDVNGTAPYKAQVVFEMPYELLGVEKAYLVESITGSLLVVSRRGQQRRKRTFKFNVFEIDLERRSWKGVKTLKNMSLFVGRNSSFSLEVNEKHHIKPNCIYFTDDNKLSVRTKDGAGKDMGIYHLEDHSIEPHFKGKSCSHFSPPLWIEPKI